MAPFYYLAPFLRAPFLRGPLLESTFSEYSRFKAADSEPCTQESDPVPAWCAALPVQEDDLNVHVLSVLVQKVFQEVGHGLIRDVATHHNMPAKV